MACVMATDSQIMALSTMFSQDVFAHYGGAKKYGETVQVWMGRAFVIVIAIRELHSRARAGRAEIHLRSGHSLRVLRLRRAGTGDVGSVVLATQQQVGSPGRCALGCLRMAALWWL